MSPKFTMKAAKFAFLRKLGTSNIDTVVCWRTIYSVRKKYSLLSRVFLVRATASFAIGTNTFPKAEEVPAIMSCTFTSRLDSWRVTISLVGLTILRDRLFSTKTDTVLFFWSCLTYSKLNIRPFSFTWLEMNLVRWSKSSTSTWILGGAFKSFPEFVSFFLSSKLFFFFFYFSCEFVILLGEITFCSGGETFSAEGDFTCLSGGETFFFLLRMICFFWAMNRPYLEKIRHFWPSRLTGRS